MTIIGHDNVYESGTVTASSEATDYPVENAIDWAAYDEWQPSAAGNSHWIKVDAGSAVTADYFALYNYTLDGGTIAVESSTDDAAWTNRYTATSHTETVVYESFTAATARYWRILIEGTSITPTVAVLSLGEETAIPSQRVGFNAPALSRNVEQITNISQQGVFLGRSTVDMGTKFTISAPSQQSADAYGDWLTLVQHAEQYPFFFYMDSPQEEKVFCWTHKDIAAASYSNYNHIDQSLEVQGIR